MRLLWELLQRKPDSPGPPFNRFCEILCERKAVQTSRFRRMHVLVTWEGRVPKSSSIMGRLGVGIATAHSASYPMGPRGSFPGGKAVGA
jgi:hypothetical protein